MINILTEGGASSTSNRSSCEGAAAVIANDPNTASTSFKEEEFTYLPDGNRKPGGPSLPDYVNF